MKTTTKTTQANVTLNNVKAGKQENTSVANEPALVKKEIINKVSISGHLGNDPEVTVLTSGMKKAKFRIATNRYFKNKEGEWQSETTWHNVIAWSDLAAVAEQQFKKGMAISVEGRLNYRMFVDANGVERFYTEIIAKSMVTAQAKQSENTTLSIAA
jgi:single-strand DNA-binding protein